MRILSTAVLSCALVISHAAVADINEDLQNICTIVKNNDKGEIRKKLKKIKDEYRFRLGDIYDGVACDGKSLIRWAMENGANDVGTFMVKQMSKSDLSKPEADGLTIQQWAEANGHIGGEIGQELIARLN